MSTFRALAEVIAAHGLPCALYTDRASHYFVTPKAGEKVAKDQLTQVGRALAQLGIEHIPAYSPEARGRSERAFGTLQDRLPKELALAGITTVEAANRFLREVYLPEHNTRFAVAPEHSETAFVADAAGSTTTRTADWLCSTARAASPATGPTAVRSTMFSQWPPDAAGRPCPVDLWTSLRLAHQPHRPHHNSGQPMCYQHRST